MAEFQLEESKRHPSRPQLRSVPEARVETDVRETIENYRGELDEYYDMVKSWAQAEPDEVLVQCSAISARLTEIRAHLNRDNGQRATRLRVSEIDPLLEQLEFQFKVHSRLQSVRELDFRMAGGQT